MADLEANAANESKDEKKEEAAKKPKKEVITDPVVLGRKLQGLALQLKHYKYEKADTKEERDDRESHLKVYWEKSPIKQAIEELEKGLPAHIKPTFDTLKTELKNQCDDWSVGYEFDKQRWDESFKPLKKALEEEVKVDNTKADVSKKIQELDTFAKEKHLEQQRKLKEQWERNVQGDMRAFAKYFAGQQTIWEKVGSQDIPEDNAAVRMVSKDPTNERLNKISQEQKDGDWYKRKDSDVYLKLEKNMISVHYRGDFIGNGNFNKAYGEALDFLALVRGAKTILIEWPEADLQRAGSSVSRRVNQIEKILKIAAEKGLKVELGSAAMASIGTKPKKLDEIVALIKKHNEPILRREKIPEDLMSIKNQAAALKKQFASYQGGLLKADADLSNAYAEKMMRVECKNPDETSKQIASINERLVTVKKAQEDMANHRKILAGCEPEYAGFREQITKVLDELKTQTAEHFDDLKIRVDGLQKLAKDSTFVLTAEDEKSLSTCDATIKALQPDAPLKISAQDSERASIAGPGYRST